MGRNKQDISNCTIYIKMHDFDWFSAQFLEDFRLQEYACSHWGGNATSTIQLSYITIIYLSPLTWLRFSAV